MIEYETKLTYRGRLQDIGEVDWAEGTPLADYFPPGDAEHFGVRFRVLGEADLSRAISLGLAPCECTVKGGTPSENARYEQTHRLGLVALAAFPAVVKQRFRVRALTLSSGRLEVPAGVAATLDLAVNVEAPPILEMEGAADLVDPLTAAVLGNDAERFQVGGPRWRKLARVVPGGAAAWSAVRGMLTAQRAGGL